MCGKSPLHDAMTVAYAVDPAMFTASQEVVLDVVVAPGTAAHGQSWVDQRPGRNFGMSQNKDRVATLLLDVDGPRFLRGLVDGIAGVDGTGA